jgi:uncharacterized protein YutE (UPF0331/DUF86 family)
MTGKDLLLKNELKEDLSLLEKAMDTFEYSYRNCKEIGIKDEYTYEELDKFEALTSRFARISDMITQKVLKGIVFVLREDKKTFIDRANFAEKIGIVSKGEDLIDIRDLRNEIAHEYKKGGVEEVFETTLRYSDTLRKVVNSVTNYIEQNILIRDS